VKSAFGKGEFLSSLEGFASIPQTTTGDRPLFGSYHYGADDGRSLSSFGDLLAQWLTGRDHVPMVVRVSPTVFFFIETHTQPHRIRLYSTENGSTAFFIAKLVSHIAALRTKRAAAFADALDVADSCTEFHETTLT
jgi:hypothetical protein